MPGGVEGANAEERPILWQLQISHYNEKVRWALDHKRIPHTRRSLPPAVHHLKATQLTGDVGTTPVLTLNGTSIGDSTRIIAALEEQWPESPLYPSDEAERRRALELEEFFDEELGPHIRRAIYQELLSRPDLVVPLFSRGQSLPTRTMIRAVFPVMRLGMRQTMKIDSERAERSRRKTVEAMDRLEAELGPNGYLVGDSFTVADLTAAALFYPVVGPAEFPYPVLPGTPDSIRPFLTELAERPGGEWVAAMYRQHR